MKWMVAMCETTRESTVDILLATYNGEMYVRHQIVSLQKQAFADWRLLVYDDCSTDGTYDVVKSMARSDDRITIVDSADVNVGSTRAFMHLLGLSTAPYVMFCDQDDVWLPKKVLRSLEKIYEMEVRYGEECPLLVFTDLEVVDCDLMTICDSALELVHTNPSHVQLHHLLARNKIPGCTELMNRPLVGLSLLVKNVERLHFHDSWVAWVGSAFGHIECLRESTMLYRRHGDNVTDAQRYAPLSNMKKSVFDKKRTRWTEEFQRDIVQCEEFLSSYQGSLSQKQVQSIEAYIKAGTSSSYLQAVRFLRNSGCQMSGARRLRQAITLFDIAALNKASTGSRS